MAESHCRYSPPCTERTPATTLRRGSFWVAGTPIEGADGQNHLQGQMFVDWLAPEQVEHPWPLVLVHGGGGQGIDWLTTPDGRPGWAYRFATEGYVVYVIDRPGHGRSPYHPELLGEPGAQASLEAAGGLFAPAGALDQTQWPWGRRPGSPELVQLAAGMSFLLADAELSQQLDGQALEQLLDQIGPAVLVTHSAGAPAGWLALNRAANQVVGIVAIEPMGPPFMDMPGFGRLPWGLTSIPVVCEPQIEDPADLQNEPASSRIVGFKGANVLVVAGAASGFGQAVGPAVSDFLGAHEAHAQFLNLGDRNIHGNGHGLMFEANSNQTIEPVLDWIRDLAGPTASRH